MRPQFAALLAITAVTVLLTTQASATPVPLTMSHNFTYSTTDTSSSKDVAKIIGGPDGALVNGAYEGAGQAFTLVEANPVFYADEVAGVKMWWIPILYNLTPDPVNLYLDLNTWVGTDETNLALGSVYHGIYAEFDITPAPSGPILEQVIVRLGDTGDLQHTYSMGQLDPGQSIRFIAIFEVASGLSSGPGFLISASFSSEVLRNRATSIVAFITSSLNGFTI